MHHTILLLLPLVLLTVAFSVRQKRRKSVKTDEANWPFLLRKPLSAPEQVLYHRLRETLPQHIVLAQVALSRILEVQKGQNRQAWNNRINRMSADFVICTTDARVIAVIELDDRSHEKPERKAADAKKDRALKAAGVNIIRWQAKALPERETIQAALAA